MSCVDASAWVPAPTGNGGQPFVCGLAAGRPTPSKSPLQGFLPPRVLAPSTSHYRMGRTGAQNLTTPDRRNLMLGLAIVAMFL